MLNVLQDIPSAAHADATPEVPQLGEETSLPILWQRIQRYLRPQEAYANTHRSGINLATYLTYLHLYTPGTLQKVPQILITDATTITV